MRAVDDILQQQATLLAYADNFRALSYLSTLCILLVLLMEQPQLVAGKKCAMKKRTRRLYAQVKK
jgi:hypothetical protein